MSSSIGVDLDIGGVRFEPEDVLDVVKCDMSSRVFQSFECGFCLSKANYRPQIGREGEKSHGDTAWLSFLRSP